MAPGEASKGVAFSGQARGPRPRRAMRRVLATGRLAAHSCRPPLQRRGSNPTVSLAEQTASLRQLLRTLSGRSSDFHGHLC